MPFYQQDKYYSTGCVVTLYSDSKFFPSQLKQYQFANHYGKIHIEFMAKADVETDIDYNMVNMTKLIVDLYEKTIYANKDTQTMQKAHFEELKQWDGIV